jgi:hypothetical protein
MTAIGSRRELRYAGIELASSTNTADKSGPAGHTHSVRKPITAVSLPRLCKNPKAIDVPMRLPTKVSRKPAAMMFRKIPARGTESDETEKPLHFKDHG